MLLDGLKYKKLKFAVLPSQVRMWIQFSFVVATARMDERVTTRTLCERRRCIAPRHTHTNKQHQN